MYISKLRQPISTLHWTRLVVERYSPNELLFLISRSSKEYQFQQVKFTTLLHLLAIDRIFCLSTEPCICTYFDLKVCAIPCMSSLVKEKETVIFTYCMIGKRLLIALKLPGMRLVSRKLQPELHVTIING